MTSLLDFPSPPTSAYGAKPLSPEEIDAHPDRDRLWATIMVLRDDMDTKEEAFSDRLVDAKESAYEAGYNEGYDDASD